MLQLVERLRDYIQCALALGPGLKEKCFIFWKETKNLRVRLKLAVYHPNMIYLLPTIYGILYFRDNFGDITNLVDLIYQNVYGAMELAQDGVILDVGANIGLAAAAFAFYNPDRTIHCFEPLMANTSLIKLNCPTARVEQVAIGARRGQVTLHVDPDFVMASLIPCPWETREAKFDVISLDEFCSEKGVGEVALLKIDVEGMETEVLVGCQKTLKKTHQIVMETHSRSRHEKALSRLRDAGFHIDSEEFEGATGLLFASSSKDHQA